MPRIPILVISLFFLTGSIAHFLLTDFFIKIMPDYLSYHWEIVIASGVLELLGAIAILIPKSRLLAGYGLIILCVVVFPANVNMALHPEKFAEIPVVFLYLRLPLQILLIWFIWWAIRLPD